MPAKMGINGFGRIGRLVFRAAMANPEVEVSFFCTGGSSRYLILVLDCAQLGLEYLWMIEAQFRASPRLRMTSIHREERKAVDLVD